jgi:iron complex outermembrane receptor protein
MKKILSLVLLIYNLYGYAQAQSDSVRIQPATKKVQSDTTRRLREVIIRPYFSTQPILRSTGSIGIVDTSLFNKQQGMSLVAAVNTVSGVRMEERSPGSYRLSIRGSLLRSPFGIRNVKIYIDEFPLTDAGGNSYLNAIDAAGIQRMQILKGPQSGVFGANSGGVVLIEPQGLSSDSSNLSLNLQGGSFGLFKENVTAGKRFGKYQLSITQAYQRSDGYRNHSAMKRSFLQAVQKYDYAASASLKALVFYSDLSYQTPGGLTAAQLAIDPKLSRPAGGAFRSAIDQQAAIYSKTIFGGLSNEWQISSAFKQVTSVFGSYTDLKNPFITNYEHRKETTYGLRTYIQYAERSAALNYMFNFGLESMGTGTDFNNSDNNLGVPGNLQAHDKLKAASNFAFLHLNFDFFDRLLLELSASANLYKYNYESIAPVAIPKQSNTFDVQIMPRVALSYLLTKTFSVKGSVSRGYSPPTIQEVRASDNVINVNLQPESGWNYETGLKLQDLNQRLFAEVTGFYYHLNEAIVRRLNENDTEYFINAGGTKQWGLETNLSYWLISLKNSGVIRSLQLRNSYTLSKFKFDDYLNGENNYSGNKLTGVPKNVVVSSIDLTFPKSYYFFVQHNYTSKIPLNDGNTVYAKQYHLLQAKLGLRNIKVKNAALEVFIGADNILNQQYSLGNDLNAVNGRYFNPAATRNYYGGLALKLSKN